MSDLRSSIIRLAATMPKGSEERKALLTVLATDKAASDTWGKRLEAIWNGFVREVVAEAETIFDDTGATDVRTGPNYINGTVNGRRFSVFWTLERGDITSQMQFGGGRRVGKHQPFSMSPLNVAAESIYGHFQGLLP